MKIKRVLALLFAVVMMTCTFGCRHKKGATLGVWWWGDLSVDTYLDFAEENGVNEVYYYVGEDATNREVADFLEEAHDRYIDVYWLDGDYRWLTDEDAKAELLNKLGYWYGFNQSTKYKFSGVHLDIEPHQHPEFESRREELITALVELAAELKEYVPSFKFCYDIPFWLHDEVTYDGVKKPAYAHMIDIAHSVTVMSYRDYAEDIFSVAEEEIDYAQSVNKTINLSVETADVDDDIVTFYEEGKKHLDKQVEELRKLIPDDFGVAIHHVESWKALKK